MDVYITKEGNQVDERPRCFNCGAYLLTEEKDACDYCKVEIMCLLLKAKISPVSPGRLKDLNETIVFRLKRFWQVGDRMVELYPAIKKGEKTSEWRDMTTYWGRRLIRSFDLFNMYHLGFLRLKSSHFLEIRTYFFNILLKRFYLLKFFRNNKSY